MHFLNPRGALRIHTNQYIVCMQRAGHFAAVAPGQRDHAHAALVRLMDRRDHIRRITAGGNRQQAVAGQAEGAPPF